MSTTALGDMLRYMRLTFEAQEERDVSDADLLERFRRYRDEAAFAVLAHRHGPMVLAVGRRVTGDAHEAEDVYQATFLAMARRAGSIGRKGGVGGWLYAVAQSIAVRAKAKAFAQRKLEMEAHEMPRAEPLDDLTWQELRSVLDEELARLPEKYRTPLVLCYLEGKSHDRAAKELGWPRTSLASRLDRAKELLHGQLLRRGVTLSVAALASALTEKARGAPVAAKLIVHTLKAAMSAMTGKVAAGTWVSGNAIALAEEGLSGMIAVKAKILVMALVLGLAVGGAKLAGYGGLATTETPAKTEGAKRPPAKSGLRDPEKKAPVVGVDIDGVPLPAGAVGRLGSSRFRTGQFTSSLAFSPSGTILASMGDYGWFEGGLWLWNAATGRALHHLSISPWDRPIAFSPDGKMLLIGGAQAGNCNFRLIEVASGKVLRYLENPSDPLHPLLLAVAYSPDGLTVVAAGGDTKRSRIFLWDAATGKVLKNLTGDANDSLWTVAFSPDGKTLATGGKGKTICLWDVAAGKVLQRLPGSEEGRVLFLSYAASGKVLASLGEDCTIRLWGIETGKMLKRLKGDLATMREMAFSPDARLLASGGRNGTIHLWDADAGKEIRAWQAHQVDISTLAFSPDGKILASTGQGDRAIRRWDTTTGKEIDPIAGHTGAVQLLRFAADGRTILSCGSDAKVLEWDLKTLRDSGRLFNGCMGPTKDGWHARVFDLSPDGKVLAVVGHWWTGERATEDQVIRFFEVATGKEIRAWELPDKGFVQTLKFSPNGKFLASISHTGTRLWEVATGKELHHVKGNENTSAVAFSADSKLLLLALGEAKVGKAIRVWDIAAAKEIHRWDSAEVQDWAPDTGAPLPPLDGLEGDSEASQTRITSVAFSPSGRVSAVGVSGEMTTKDSRSFFCKIHLIDMISGKEIRQIDAPQGTVYSLAFAPDGRTLAAGGADSTILLWDITGHAEVAASKPVSWSAKDLEALWSDLAGDATKADQSIWALAFAPKQSVSFLKARLHVVTAPAEEVAKLVADLDSDQFAVRQKAAKALDDLGETAEAALRKAMAANPPLEVRQRLEQILEKREKEVIRKLRAVETLEHIGNAEAQQVLQEMAKGAPNPRVAEAASAALLRIAKRVSGMR